MSAAVLRGLKTKSGIAEALKAIKRMSQRHVLVGIPGDAEPRKGDEPTNPQLGYIHEFGAPEENIPARPFLIPGVTAVKEDVVNRYRGAAKAALRGKVDAIEHAHDAVGLIAQNSVRKRINTGPFVPLAPMTIANRKAKGRKGIKPLIDTGQLRNSLTYVIRDDRQKQTKKGK